MKYENLKSTQKYNSIDKKSLNEDKEINMWISEKYCKSWGLREAIRELIQNQYDGIITEVGTKKNLNIKKAGKEYILDGKKKYLDYDFFKKEELKKVGEIRYNKYRKELSISNKGELFLADFLLGGSKDEQNNSELIGTFGEGMKLAILALCRLGKDVIIISSNKIYSFRIKEDKNFIKNSIPQKCLHCKIDEIFDKDYISQVKVIIQNIDENEWINEINNFLWLIDNDIEIYTSIDNDNKELGNIIYEDHLKSRLYVKGIFVQEIKEDTNHEVPGFNTILKIDRDRNCIQDREELKIIISKILGSALNKNVDYFKHIQEKTNVEYVKAQCGFEKGNNKEEIKGAIKSQFKNLVKDIINFLESEKLNIVDYNQLKYTLSKESIEIIWNEMDSRPGNKNKQPKHYINYVKNFIESKKLPIDFYPYYYVPYGLMEILEKSEKHISIEEKFKEYVEHSQNVEPEEKYKIALNEVCSKVKIKINDFNESKIIFKKFEAIDVNLCFINEGIIYFSSDKLKEKPNKEWKFWIFVKILNAKDIKIEDSYILFNQVLKTKYL